jgi:hypothetical protein
MGLALLADKLGFPRYRLTLHSLRIGGAAQLLAGGVDPVIVMLLGGWRTEQGLGPYLRNSIQHALTAAATTYDESLITPPRLRMAYLALEKQLY